MTIIKKLAGFVVEGYLWAVALLLQRTGFYGSTLRVKWHHQWHTFGRKMAWRCRVKFLPLCTMAPIQVAALHSCYPWTELKLKLYNSMVKLKPNPLCVYSGVSVPRISAIMCHLGPKDLPFYCAQSQCFLAAIKRKHPKEIRCCFA